MASLGITCSPVRNIIDQKNLSFQPYGGSPATNVLEHFLGTPDIITNVLFLGCGDLRNVLFTCSKLTAAYPELIAHISDETEFIIARNFLIAYIMLEEDFDPCQPEDLQYFWDVWYGYQWNDMTRRRFVKDLKSIMTHRRWDNSTLVFPQCKAFEHLKSIFKLWLDTACNMTPTRIDDMLEKRVIPTMRDAAVLNSLCNQLWLFVHQVEENSTKAETVDAIKRRICVKTFYGNLPPSSVDEEIENLVKTGNCLPIVDKIVCLNPTFFVQANWQPFYLSCPFDAYFPVPVDEQLASTETGFATTSVYRYCQSKLEALVTAVRAKKDRIQFHFYFGDCLELCLGEKKLINKCEVVHCSDLGDRVGLANLILAASHCLSSGNPGSDSANAVLVTETSHWKNVVGMQRLNTEKHVDETLADYITISLRCPLSLVPTLYGLRLTNHAHLGSPLCVQRHDSISASRLTLKWLRTFGYSNNVRVDVSPDMKTAIDRFVDPSFLIKAKNRPPPGIPELPNTPLSFYYFIFSLADRMKWSKERIETVFCNLPIPTDYQLEWRTQRSWMMGESVLLYSLENSGLLRDAFLEASDMCFIQLLLVSPRHLKRFNAQFGMQLPVEFFSGVTCIENVSWSRSRKDFMFDATDRFKDTLKQTLSFILAKDHGLDFSTHLCFVCMTNLKLIGTIEVFPRSTCKEIVNRNPLCRHVGAMTADVNGISKCLEFEDRYEIDVTIPGSRINDVQDVVVSTDQTHPSWSAHNITLAVEDVAPVTVQVPWPALVKSIQLSIQKKGKKRNTVHLVMKKSLSDPWPIEFGGRSKWDVDRLKHWKDLVSNGDLKMHIDAQFSCDLLQLDKRIVCYSHPVRKVCTISKTALDEVREIVRAIFYGYDRRSFFLFAIYDHLDEPVFHIRVQPPIRFTPQGSPLLLMSVIDHQLAKQLIAEGKLDEELNQSEFHRIITQGVSREVCSITTSSAEEIDMFRYVIRLNSTKMRRGVWTSKNLFRGEGSPWLPTFISPIYVETIQDQCHGILTLRFRKLESLDPPGKEKKADPFCATCYVKKIQLKKCTGCKIISYCSVECQKRQWPKHKMICGLQDLFS